MKPWYRPVGHEVTVFASAHKQALPVLLKGPTGSGKSRFVEYMADQSDRPLIQVACNEDTSASDLIGRFLIKGGETVWVDGPVTRAVRTGSFLYLDEVAEAREDVMVVLHSLSDFRRTLYIDKTGESLNAAQGFQMIMSFNPGYQSRLKEMKPSTRQRFVTIAFDFPTLDVEVEIVSKESGVDLNVAKKLCALGEQIRKLTELPLKETASTRLLVYAAKLIHSGLHPRLACDSSIVQTITDDAETVTALRDLVELRF